MVDLDGAVLTISFLYGANRVDTIVFDSAQEASDTTSISWRYNKRPFIFLI